MINIKSKYYLIGLIIYFSDKFENIWVYDKFLWSNKYSINLIFLLKSCF